jgi:hypothetical protein
LISLRQIGLSESDRMGGLTGRLRKSVETAPAPHCGIPATLFRGSDRLLTRLIHGVGFRNGVIPLLRSSAPR